jgi:predicted nucleic acid-binding protein
MTTVADSGPLIHLAAIGQFALLRRYFHKVFIVPQVYDEVVIQGRARAGEGELLQAIEEGWIALVPVAGQTLVLRLTAPNISETDAAVVACALEKGIIRVLADDPDVRGLAEQEGLQAIGTVGILVHACLEGVIPELKPLLDELISSGFHLDPHARVYQDALKRVGESQ